MSRHVPSRNWRLGLSLSLLTALLWGCLPVALSLLLQAVTAATLMWFRFTVAAGLLGVLLASRRALPALSRLNPTTVFLLVLATFGLSGNYLFFQWGLKHTSPGTAQILGQASPVLFLLSSVLLFGERLTRLQTFGLFMLLSGFALFFCGRGDTPATDDTYGAAFILLAAASWTTYALAQKQLLTVLGSQGIMLIVYFGGALISLPFASPAVLGSLSPLSTALLIFAALNTVFAYGAFAEALAHWEASRVSAVLSLTPVLTFTCAKLTNHFLPGSLRTDILSPVNVLGAAFVVCGSASAALGQKRRLLPTVTAAEGASVA